MYKTYYKLLLISVFVLATFTFVGAQTTTDEAFDLSQIKNQEIIAAFGNAKAYDKTLLIIFDAVWCQYCKQLREETMQNAEVLDTLDKYEKLNVDVDENEADADIFNGKPKARGGNGIPAIIIFSPQGKELERITGFQDAKNFNIFLKRNLKKLK